MEHFYEKMAKCKQPSKSFSQVQKAVSDKLIVAKLEFFSFIADHFKPFLTVYQVDAPMKAFLYSDFKKLLHQLFSLIVKANVMEKSKNICSIDLDNKENILPLKTVNTGFAAEGTISKFIASDMLSLSEGKTFRREFIKFVVFTFKSFLESHQFHVPQLKMHLV